MAKLQITWEEFVDAALRGLSARFDKPLETFGACEFMNLVGYEADCQSWNIPDYVKIELKS